MSLGQKTAIFLSVLFSHQLVVAPLAWAECAHHFDLFNQPEHQPEKGQTEYQKQIESAPLCGEDQADENQTLDTEQENHPHDHKGTCSCGDLTCNFASAATFSPVISISQGVEWVEYYQFDLLHINPVQDPQLLPYAHGPPGFSLI